MEPRIAQLNKIASQRIRNKAIRWVTELHGPDRNEKLEARVRRWIARDPRHAAAFDLANKAWQSSGGLHGRLTERTRSPARSRFRPTISLPAFAGMSVMAVVIALAIHFLRDDTLVTGAAEQRTAELPDGTQVSLNANSQVVVQYDNGVRRVTLTDGEILIHVVKHESRPFVVIVGEHKVIAMGTSFVVRREESTGPAFAVTLVEGRVAVEPRSWPDALPSAPINGVKILSTGERLRVAGDATETVDSPSIERITAWHRGQLIFDDTTLNEAAAEFNRYGPNKIEIDGPAVGKLRIGGVFGIGDANSFAYDMANTFHLRVITRGNIIVLTDKHTE